MRRINRLLVLLAAVFSLFINSFAGEVEENIQKLAAELEAKYPGYSKIKVAILQFRTSDNKLTRFNQFIQDELSLSYKNSKRFEVIDQYSVNRLTEAIGWDINKSNSYNIYNELSEQIFRNVGVVPDAFIYGQITDNYETIVLTGFLVPNGVKGSSVQSIIKFASSELTDQLLGKPVRVRPSAKPKVDTVVVYKEKIVEKPVVVEKQVVVEKPVYVEKQVIVEKPQAQEAAPASTGIKGKIGDLEVEILSAQNTGGKIVIMVNLLNDTEDMTLPTVTVRFFDTEGNEYHASDNTLTWAKLIAGVPAKKKIIFERGNLNSVKTIRVLEIELNQTGKIQLRNIPVTQ